MRGITVGCLAAVLAAVVSVPDQAAPPYNTKFKPLDTTNAKLRPTRPIKIDPSLLDVQMNFDFQHAYKVDGGYNLTFPGAPTAVSQGAIVTLFDRGLVWPEPGNPASASLMVFSATDQLATADFISNTFELSKRRAVVLDWYGYFQPVNFPIQIRLSFGQDGTLGAVTFDQGLVLVGPAGQETPIGAYPPKKTGSRHHVQIRADLVARTYTVLFEQGGQSFTSPPVAFPAGTPPVPAGLQRVTARLTSPKPYVVGDYDLSRLTLKGETGP